MKPGLALVTLACGIFCAARAEAQVADFIARQLSKAIRGRIEIGRIEGPVVGRVTLRDVSIFDDRGRPVIRAGRLTMRYDPWALARKRLRAEALSFHDAKVALHFDPGAGLSLARVFSGSGPSRPGGSSRFELALDSIQISHGTLEFYDGIERRLRLDALELHGTIKLFNNVFSLELLRGTGRWSKLSFSLQGTLELAGEQLSAEGVTLDIAAGRLLVPRFELGLEHGRIEASFAVHAPESLLRTLAHDGRLGLQLLGHGHLLRSAQGLWNLDFHGRIAPTIPVDADLEASPSLERFGGRMRFPRFDPHTLYPELPRGELELELVATELAPRWPLVDGDLDLEASGWLEPKDLLRRVAVDRLGVNLRARRGAMQLTASLGTGMGILAARGGVRLVDGQPYLEEFALTARRFPLALLKLATPLRGAASGTMMFQGPPRRLDMQGTLAAPYVSALGLSATGAELSFTLGGVPSAPKGTIHAKAKRLLRGPLRVEEARARLALRGPAAPLDFALTFRTPASRANLVGALSRAGPERTILTLSRLSLDHGRTHWTGGARLLVDGDIWIVREFVLRSATASMTLSTTLAPGRLEKGPLELLLSLRGLDAGALLQPWTNLRVPSGPLELELAAGKRHGILEADLSASSERLVLPGLDAPIAFEVKAALDWKRLRLGVEASGAQLGSVTLTATTSVPRSPLEPRAWIDPLQLQTLETNLSSLDLAALARLLGREGDVEGRLDGRLRARAETAELHLEAANLRLRALRAPISASLRGALAAGTLALSLDAAVPNGPILLGQLTTPLSLEDARRYYRSMRPDFDARLELVPGPIEALQSALPGLASNIPLGGTLGGHFLARRRQGRFSVEANAYSPGLQVGDAPLAAVDLGAKLEGSALRVEARLDGAGSARASAALDLEGAPFAASTWKRLGPESFTVLTATASDVDLGAWSAVLEGPGTLSGKAAARLRAGRGLEGLTLWATAREFRPTPLFEPLDGELHVERGPDQLEASIGIFSKQRPLAFGTLRTDPRLLAGSWPPPATTAVAGTLTLQKFPLMELFADPSLSEAFGGEAQGRVTLMGTLGAPALDFALDLSRSTLAGVRFEEFLASGHLEAEQTTARVSVRDRMGGDLRFVLAQARNATNAELQANGLDLGFVSALAKIWGAPESAIGGKLSARFIARGSAAPRLVGSLRLDNARFLFPDALPAFEQVFGEATLDDEFRIQLRGLAGGGEFTLDVEGQPRDADTHSFSGTLTSEDVRVAAGPLVLGLDTLALFSGTLLPGQLRASLVLEETSVRLPDETPETLHPIADLEDVTFVDGVLERRGHFLTRSATAAAALNLELELRSARPIAVRGRDASGRLDLAVRVRSHPRGLTLQGEVATRQGELTLLGRRYEVSRALATFSDEYPPDPHLDLILTHEFPTTTFSVRVGGTARRPEVRFEASPGDYDQAELTRIFAGATPESLQDESSPGFREQAASAAAGVLAGELESRLLRQLPIEVRFDSRAGDGGTLLAGALTLGRWLSDDLFLAYSYRFQPGPTQNQSEGLLRYRLFGAWLFELIIGDRSNHSADVLWVERF